MYTAARMAALFCLSAVLLAAFSSYSLAQENELSADEVQQLLKVKVRTAQHMALNPVVVRAVRQQNASQLTLDEIKRRDDEWKSTKGLTRFKRALQQTPAGKFLRQQIERNPSFAEAFLTDDQGANVAAFPATSDYWQGDEDKWSASFNGGQGRIFVGPLEFDDSTQTVQVQISAPVLDRGKTTGVLVVGVTITYLEAKRR